MRQETELEALEEVVMVVPLGKSHGSLAHHRGAIKQRSKINAAAVKDRKPISLARTSLEKKP